MRGALLGLGAFGFSVAGATPELHWFDSGELIAGAWQIGVSHPPGQPAWTLLARGAALIPLGPLAFRMTLVSALAAAGSVVLADKLLRQLCGTSWPPALFLAAALGGHPMLAIQAQRPEVYAPALCLLLLALYATLRVPPAESGGLINRRALGVASLAGGLLLGLHPLVGGAAALAAGAWLLGTLDTKRGPPALLATATLGVLGTLTYALLPIRSASGALFAWGNPNSLGRFVDVLTARAYRGNFGAGGGAGGFLERLGGHLLLLGEALSPVLAVLALIGLIGGLRRRPLDTLLLFGVGLVVLATSLSQRVFFPQNPDVQGYLIPVVALTLVAAATTLATLWEGIKGHALAPTLLAPGIVALGALPALAAPGSLSQAHLRLPRLIASEALADVAPHGTMVTASDHTSFGVLYLQAVEGARPDTTLAIAPLFHASWHLAQIKAQAAHHFVPFIDDGNPRKPLLRFLRDPSCAGSPAGRCVVEDPGSLRRIAGPGAWGRLLYRPGHERPAAAAAAPLIDLAQRAGTSLSDPVMRYHAKARARHLAATGRLDAAAKLLLQSLGASPGALPPAEQPPGPAQYDELPRLTPSFVSDVADLQTLFADLLAASGRRDAAQQLWASASSVEMGLLAVHHLYLWGEKDESQRAYEAVLQHFPAHRIEVLYNLGVFFARQGAGQVARAQFATLLAEDPHHHRAPLSRRYLDRLTHSRSP